MCVKHNIGIWFKGELGGTKNTAFWWQTYLGDTVGLGPNDNKVKTTKNKASHMNCLVSQGI